MVTVKENLIAAKALIDTPEMWGQGLDRDCFCALDAVDDVAIAAGVHGSAYNGLSGAVLLGPFVPAEFEPDTSNWDHPVAQFNDDPSTTHADIMALFDRAIEAQP